MFDAIDALSSDLWLLPDGVEELLPPEAYRAEQLRRVLLDSYARWGYQMVVPPLIENLESLLTGAGQDLDLQTFKLTDQMSGKLLGVRADITPQVSRIDTRNHADGAHRLSYIGTVLRTRTNNLFASRTPIQTGCELFGVSDSQADIEVISLMLETLALARIEKVHLDLAHVGIFQMILQRADFPDNKAPQLFGALQRKSIPELDQLLQLVGNPTARDYLKALPAMAGKIEVLQQAQELFAAEPGILASLEQLSQVAEVVAQRYPEVEINVDLCEMRGFNYHTGLVFAAFTEGLGQAVAQGGRYDGVGSKFGKSRPATGFSADLKALLNLGGFAPPSQMKAILAPHADEPALWSMIRELRLKERVIVCLPGEEQLDRQEQCDREIVKDATGQWTVVPYRR